MAILVREESINDSNISWFELSVSHSDLCDFKIGVKSPEADEVRRYDNSMTYFLMSAELTELYDYIVNTNHSMQGDVKTFNREGYEYRWGRKDFRLSLTNSPNGFIIEITEEDKKRTLFGFKIKSKNSYTYTVPSSVFVQAVKDVHEMYILHNSY